MSQLHNWLSFIPGLRLALVQLAVGASKADNIQRAAKHVAEAAKAGAHLVALPVSQSPSVQLLQQLMGIHTNHPLPVLFEVTGNGYHIDLGHWLQ